MRKLRGDDCCIFFIDFFFQIHNLCNFKTSSLMKNHLEIKFKIHSYIHRILNNECVLMKNPP